MLPSTRFPKTQHGKTCSNRHILYPKNHTTAKPSAMSKKTRKEVRCLSCCVDPYYSHTRVSAPQLQKDPAFLTFKVVPRQHKEGTLFKKAQWILCGPRTAKDGVRKKEQDILAGVLEAHTEYSLAFRVCFQSSLITINSSYILTRFGATCNAKQMCAKAQ